MSSTQTRITSAVILLTACSRGWVSTSCHAAAMMGSLALRSFSTLHISKISGSSSTRAKRRISARRTGLSSWARYVCERRIERDYKALDVSGDLAPAWILKCEGKRNFFLEEQVVIECVCKEGFAHHPILHHVSLMVTI